MMMVEWELQKLSIDSFSGFFGEEMKFLEESLVLFECSLIFCNGSLVHFKN